MCRSVDSIVDSVQSIVLDVLGPGVTNGLLRVGVDLGDRTTFVVLICTVIIGITWLLLKDRPATSKKRSILLVGPSGAGKTAIFHQLTFPGTEAVGFLPSVHVNTGEALLDSPKKPVRMVPVVDLPGYRKLWHHMDQHLGSAACVVFVLDASNFLPVVTEIADLLMEVLGRPEIARKGVPVLIACNKQDLGAKVHTTEFLRKTLQKRIGTLMKTRVELEKAGAASKLDLGRQDSESFLFDACRSSVTFAPTSVLAGQLEPIHSFVAKHT